jgi:hydroxymethylpyrimidine pyrophosphatase-like HAD family hydrolase
LDGTLLNSHHEVSSTNIKAIQQAMLNGFKFIPATGRTRLSMGNAIGEKVIQELFGDLHTIPGVYQQGLMVFGLDGKLIYERALDTNIISTATEFCKRKGIAVVAYCADEIYCEQRTSETDRVMAYKDPAPKEFADGLDKLSTVGVVVHKLIILSDPHSISGIRDDIEPILQGKATLTQAVPDMLEILPLGGSKGDGVMRFLEHIGVRVEDTIAFGGKEQRVFQFTVIFFYKYYIDGENDIEMLSLVKYGVAMQNAKSKLKAVSKFETLSNLEDGVAYSIQSILKTLQLNQHIDTTAVLEL